MQFPKLSSIRPSKTWIVLGVALGIGTLAALVARGYLSNRLAEIEARGKGKMINVVVAKRELRKGERLSEDTAAVRPIPADYAHSLAIAPDNFERAEGQILAYPVKSGEMILWSLLEGKKNPPFSARVAEGRRAISVPVDEINSLSGMLEPGDTIDLVATMDVKGKKNTFVLLQGIAVLATGQRSIDDPRSGEKRQYTTVTLDTTPDQAQNIVAAREAGKLTALLRNPQDKAPLVTGRNASQLGKRLAGDYQEVPVLYGGRGAKIQPEALHLGHNSLSELGDKPQSGANSALNAPASQIPVINNPIRPQ